MPGVVRVFDTARAEDAPPGAGYLEDGMLVAWHVTDDPKKLLSALKRRINLVAAYGPKGQHAELGPGLYVSGAPEYWSVRAQSKWAFLTTLSDEHLSRLTDALAFEINKQERNHWLSRTESEFGFRVLDDVDRGRQPPAYLTALSGQPYAILFWKESFLKPLGIRGSGPPALVEVRLSGKFAELASDWPAPDVLRRLRRMGYSGVYTRPGLGTAAELVVWDARTVKSAHVVPWRE